MYSDNITKSVSEAVKKIMDEELKGQQHKIDKNHNNKIDGQDFAILRGEKKTMKKEEVEQLDELSPALLDRSAKLAAKKGKDARAKGHDEAGDEHMGQAVRLRSGYHNAVERDRKKASMSSMSPAKQRKYAISQKRAMGEEVELEEGIEDRLEAARAKAKAAGKPIKDKPTPPKSNVRKIEGSAYGGARQKDEPEDDDDTTMKSTKKGTFKRRYNTKTYKESFTDRLEAYNEGGLKSLLETMQYEIVEEFVEEEATNDEFTKELDDAKAKNSGAKKNKEIAEPSVQAVKNEEVEQIDERELTADENAKKEHIVKSMKKGLAGFKERYGKDAKSVMYATATKQAKGE